MTYTFHTLQTHPDVASALNILGPHAYDTLRRQTCTIIYALDIASQSLKDGDSWDPLYSIDCALFALYEVPDDEVAQEQGFEGSIYGAFSIIARDFGTYSKKVERRFKVLDVRVTKVFLSRLIQELEVRAHWSYASTIELLLQNLVDVS